MPIPTFRETRLHTTTHRAGLPPLVMFESIQDGLSTALRSLSGKGKLSEANMREGLGSVEQALLEADVSYSVVQRFMARVADEAVGEQVLAVAQPEPAGGGHRPSASSST